MKRILAVVVGMPIAERPTTTINGGQRGVCHTLTAQRQKRAKAAGDNAEKVVRSYARLAAQLYLPWHAVHVETPKQQR
jgi:hypothetical protein